MAERILPNDFDLNLQKVYNPRAPIEPTDIVRLQDLTGYAAPIGATYITQTPSGVLTNEQAMSLSATGVVMNTTATGVLSTVAFTEGAIPYGAVTPVGHLTQAPTALFYNATSIRLGIGTNAPVGPLHVIVDGAARGFRVGDAANTDYWDFVSGGVETQFNFVGAKPFKFNHQATTRLAISTTGDITLTPNAAFRISAGTIQTDGLGSTGLIKNNNGTTWTIAVAGTDFVSPATQIIAGDGLTGGGDLSASRTLTVVTADATIVVAADSIRVGAINTANINNSQVTDAKLRDSAALSVLGRSVNSSGPVADITGASNGQVLRIAASAIGWGSLVGSSIGGFTAGSVIFASGGGTLTEDNAAFFWNDSTNRLGIGTASPQAPLHAIIDGTNDLGFRFGNAGNTEYLEYIHGGAEARLQFVAAKPFKINHQGTPRVTISSTGDLTFAANALFRVSTGAVQLDGIGATGIVYNTNGGNLSIAQGAAMSVVGRSANSVGVLADIAGSANGQVLRIAGSTVGWGAITGSLVTGFTAGSVIFAHSDGTLTQDNASFFYNDSNNRLGIGTTSPQAPLHVIVDVATSKGFRFGDAANTDYVDFISGGVEARLDFSTARAFKITVAGSTRWQITSGGDIRLDPAANTYIASGTIRTDGLGTTGLIKNTHGGNWSIAISGTDYEAGLTFVTPGNTRSGNTITADYITGLAGAQTWTGSITDGSTTGGLTIRATSHATVGPITLTASQIRAPFGTSSAPMYTFTAALGFGMWVDGGAGVLAWSHASNYAMSLSSTTLALVSSASIFQFGNADTNVTLTRATNNLNIKATGGVFLPSTNTNADIAALTLDNSSATGNPSIQFKTNGTLRGTLRVDYVGDMIMAAGSGGEYFFLTGGDFSSGGATKLHITAAGVVTMSNLGGGSAALVKASTAGLLSRAVAGTDYEVGLTFSNGVTRSGSAVVWDYYAGKTGNHIWYGSIDSGGTLNIHSSSHSTKGAMTLHGSAVLGSASATLGTVSSYWTHIYGNTITVVGSDLNIGIAGSGGGSLLFKAGGGGVGPTAQGVDKINGQFNIGTSDSNQIRFYTNSATGLLLTAGGNLVTGPTGAMVTTAVDGFLHLSTCPGAPSGAATAYSGKAAVIYDTSNLRLYVRESGGAWRWIGTNP